VLQMRDGGHADVLPVLQVPAGKADAEPCEGVVAISLPYSPFCQEVLPGRLPQAYL